MEQLFLTGHHLEQYRHATYLPMDYYMEALSRDEGDIRCNNAVGLLLMRRGRFAEAQKYFERAIKTQTERNPNPYDGEPYYNLGWSKKMQATWTVLTMPSLKLPGMPLGRTQATWDWHRST